MPDTATAIRAERLTKLYGEARGVLDLSFAVDTGEVFGFLGPNGAGKTTTIRLILDLIRPTGGRVEVFGADPRRDGRSPAADRLPAGRPSPLRAADCARALHLLRPSARAASAGRGRGATPPGSSCALDRPIGSLSKGNRQKVGLVQAFMHEPDLLVLDEPTGRPRPADPADVLRARL